MRPSTSILQLAVTLSSLAPLASAWPGWLPDVNTLVVRQDDSEPSSTAAETGATATRSEVKATGTKKPESNDDDDLNTARPTKSETGTQTGTATDGSKKTKPTKTKTVAPDAAVGGVKITNPVTSLVPTALYKIGDYVTLGWNYTSLEVTPTAIDVLLSCSTASETWTLTANMTFETDVTYVWDSQKQADDSESPLLTEMYTLIIKDSEAEVSEAPKPGELGANKDFKFGLYYPVDYTPWPEWECTGCNGASASFDGQAVRLAFIMCTVTIFTFTWFVTGVGIH